MADNTGDIMTVNVAQWLIVRSLILNTMYRRACMHTWSMSWVLKLLWYRQVIINSSFLTTERSSSSSSIDKFSSICIWTGSSTPPDINDFSTLESRNPCSPMSPSLLFHSYHPCLVVLEVQALHQDHLVHLYLVM